MEVTFGGHIKKSGFWLTSFWGWFPEEWGCVSFSQEWMRDKFIERTEPGVIVAIYVSGSSPSSAELKKRLVGLYEISHEKGHLYEFISADQKQKHENDPRRKEKWHFSLRANRAWTIDQQQLPFVDDVLPQFVTQATGTIIGARGLPVVEPDHIANMLKLSLKENRVFGRNTLLASGTSYLGEIAKVSKAVYPPKEPYFVAESDGPKHLYILKLNCKPSDWLTHERSVDEDAHIIKVGFSRSPPSRCRQIQSAYPAGRFKWKVIHPNPIPDEAPFPDAESAIVGEDTMKDYLSQSPGRILGGEFFLATDSEIVSAWKLGMAKSQNEQHS